MTALLLTDQIRADQDSILITKACCIKRSVVIETSYPAVILPYFYFKLVNITILVTEGDNPFSDAIGSCPGIWISPVCNSCITAEAALTPELKITLPVKDYFLRS